MSSVDSVRHAALAAKHEQLKTIASSHRAELRTLFAVYTSINDNAPLAALLNFSADADSPTDDDEAEFLRIHHVSSGRTLDATTQLLTIRPPPPPTPPPPPPPPQDAPISIAEPTSVPPASPRPPQATPSAGATPEPAIDAPQADESASSIPHVASEPLPTETDHAPTAPSSRKASVQPEDASPVDVAIALPEEDAPLPAPTQQSLDQPQLSEPPPTVQSPHPEVQEETPCDQATAEQRRRFESEAKPSQRLAASHTEAASSPSSTVGAHSATTPQLAQDSPDTSPDSEAAVEVPQDLQPSAEQLREKEEHDRLLEAQKEIARQTALGDVSTPDDQLKWEERAAAARDATERAAREEAHGPEPGGKTLASLTEAEAIVDGMDVDANGQHAEAQEESQGEAQEEEVAKPAPQAAEAGMMPPPEPQNDGENTAVPRSKSQPSATTPHAQPAVAATPAPLRMTTRVSSGAIRQKSVSEILGQDRGRSQSTDHALSARKEARTPDPVSPFTQRHPHDMGEAHTGISAGSPAKQPLLAHYRQSDDLHAVMDQLEGLKGAADDPEKDYLEPLFRIQAHESQNSRTRTLPELIKMAPKALATEDHFTSMHERLDFRMLRRIYQLQNANKWSLRQMEKQQEPAQPFTHHDHMMEEMRWMRKDFRAERQMKKSVCAWLAHRCAEWYHADADERSRLQVTPKAPRARTSEELLDSVPDLDGGDSGPEDDANPPTPREDSPMPITIVAPLELVDAVNELRQAGKLSKALAALPEAGLLDLSSKHPFEPYTCVSKFIEGKVLPAAHRPSRKRSRYEYADEDELLEAEPRSKRMRESAHQDFERSDCALFDPINKPIRDRLHSNNAFRPPSEFLMPNTQFYEYRTGSQWVWEDDQKLRKLAKDYSFNWSLIADEMALPSRYKSAAERRTPWECFERWVDLESLPADMRKTVYFKTWYARLEQAQQASERRYQQQVQVIQQQAAQNGTPSHIPIRRKSTPTRVEKRRSTRYLWMVEGFRKLAKKREQAAWKQAETARAAAQRKSQSDSNPPGPRMKMTPQEFSKKRAERDAVIAEQQRQHRLKMLEAQRQQIAAARAAQQMQMAGGPQAQAAAAGQQRPPPANMPAQQAQMHANGQLNAQMAASQGRAGLQMATRNGHLAPPPVNGQGIPQAQMQARAPQMAQNVNLQAQSNNAQMRNAQYYPVANGNIASAQQVSGMTTQQQLQENQALLAAYRQQQQQQQQQGGATHNSNQQINGSPSMPPPPTPQSAPQKLSSGHTPQIYAITNQVRAANPSLSEDQVNALAIQQLAKQTSQQTSNQARQNAINAASGMPNQSQTGQAYPQKQGQYAQRPMANGVNGTNGVNGMYPQTNVGSGGQPQNASSMSPQGNTNPSQAQDDYRAQLIRNQQLQMPQMRQMQSPNNTAAQLYSSPVAASASPHMSAASPGQSPYQNVNQMAQMAGTGAPHGSSRSNTPQMQRLSSTGSVNTIGTGGGMQSPGAMNIAQNSPRSLPASMAQ